MQPLAELGRRGGQQSHTLRLSASYEEHLQMKAILKDEARTGGTLREISRSLPIIVVVRWRSPSAVVVGGRVGYGGLGAS